MGESSVAMSIAIWQVDAFTEKPFSGNPAAICLLNEHRPADRMQSCQRLRSSDDSPKAMSSVGLHRSLRSNCVDMRRLPLRTLSGVKVWPALENRFVFTLKAAF